MQIKETYRNNYCRVLKVSLQAGEKTPLHKTTSEAFIINTKGRGKISFEDREIILSKGESVLIKANVQHKLEILQSMEASIILDADAKISYLNN